MGVSSEDAAAVAGVSAAGRVRWFREGGGMPSVTLAPPSGRYLSFAEREDIAILRAQGAGCARSRGELGRSPSTISRELRRNAATRSGAPGLPGDRRRSGMPTGAPGARRPPSSRVNAGCVEYVQDRLAGRCSGPTASAVPGPGGALDRPPSWPRARTAAGRRRGARSRSPTACALDFPDDESMRVSHEAIYQSLYVQGRGALRRELTACLRTGRALRVPRARVRGRGKGFVTDEVLISQRPAEAEDRAVPGHWEGDLILGLEQLGDRHAGRAHQPLHDAAAPPADGRPRRPADQERPGAGRARRRGRPRRDRRRDRRRCPSSCAGR